MAESIDIRELNERIERQSAFVTNLTTGMDQIIVGQKHLVESLLIGLLSDGHVLLEGVPGLAKTLAIKTLASLMTRNIAVFSSLPTYCRPMLLVQWFTVRKMNLSKYKEDLSLPTSYWRMK